MQKWIGVGRIDGEPIRVKYENKDAILMWINIPRHWSNDSDNVPVMFYGSRINMLEQASTGTNTYSGALVYVMGELSSRIKVCGNKNVDIGCCVFATSIEFWDVEHITDFTKGKPNNKKIMMFKEEI